MTLFDYAVLLIIGISILLSVMRGVVREVLALLSWVAAFFVAKTYVGDVVPYLPQVIPNDALRMLAAFVALFLGSLLLMSLLSIAASELIKTLGLGAVDKGLGIFFGFARGFLIVCLLVMLGGLTPLPHQGLWQNAMFSAPLEALVMSNKHWLPDDFSKRIHYE